MMTGEFHVAGITTVVGTVTIADNGTVTRADDGIVAITLKLTLSGTADQVTAILVLATQMSEFGEIDEAYVAGMITGFDHVDGTTTVNGTVTNDVYGTVSMNVDGTEAMTSVGTELGTLFHEMTTIDGEPEIVPINDDETDDTKSAGTTTGVYQLLGTVTVTEIDGIDAGGSGAATPLKIDSQSFSVAPLNKTFGVARTSGLYY
jgi:hypothetical protein